MSRKTPTFKFALSQELIEYCEKNDIDFSQFIPTRANDKDTGWDVRCADIHVSLVPFKYYKINLGFRVLAPEGWWLKLEPRSSSFAKKHFHALYGTIDQIYEGPCLFAFQYIPDGSKIITANSPKTIEFGEKIGQIIPFERMDMDCELISNADYDLLCEARAASRGAGGFGSTGS